MTELNGLKVAILVAEGFEQVELEQPREALDMAGAQTQIVSSAHGRVQGWNHFDKGALFEVNVPLEQARAEDFDALLLPGGVANPDQLRVMPKAVQFVRAFFDAGKPVAAICHGPWVLIDAGVVRGLEITSWPSLRADLSNAGAKWVDREVVVDKGLISSRKPADIPAFNREVLAQLDKVRTGHSRRAAAGV
jgi:protease I